MKTLNLELETSSVELIASLIGETWRSISGWRLSQAAGHVLSADEFVALRTASSNVDITLEQTWSDFQGLEDDYDLLGARVGQKELGPDERAGDIDFSFAGVRIVAISLVRDHIAAKYLGDVRWEVTSDSGLIFELESGSVAIFKSSLAGSRILNVAIADKRDDIAIPDYARAWTEGARLGEEYEVTREFIPIDDLLKAAKG